MGSRVGEPSPGVDLWAPIGINQLPGLVNAVTSQDWPRVRDQLATVMDAVSTDGVYGRQLLELVMRLPLGIYPVCDRYRAAIAIDHGDWVGLQKCLERGLVEAAELVGVREVEVLDLARHGLTNRDIAESLSLSLSPHTIARHLANARANLGAANRAEAAAKFEEMKI